MHTSAGLRCRDCSTFFPWAHLPFMIQRAPDDGLVWMWFCPLCRKVLRSEPFSFPPDYVWDDEELEATG